MQVIRRLYLYVMSGITLAVIATGMVLLLRVALDGFFPDPYEGDYGRYDNSREQLSQAIAMLGVGTPVWAIHWWLVQRGLRAGRPERDAEHGSGIRAIYLTGVLLVSLLVWVPSAVALLQWFVTDLINAVPEYSYQDPLGSATAGFAGFAIWLYHGLVRRRDLGAGPVSDTAAWLPRLYLYGVTTGALILSVTAFGTLITSVYPVPEYGASDSYPAFYLVQQAISTIGWGLVWLGHWLYSTRLISHPDWRGTEERVSRTRVAAFVIVIVVAAGAALSNVARAIQAVIAPLMPDPGILVEADVLSVIRPLVAALPWVLVWFAHARAFRREPAAADPLRALHQERLLSHGVAAVTLAMGVAGAGWLLGYALKVLLGGTPVLADGYGSSAYELAMWLPLAFVGLAGWAWSWRSVLARRRLDPDGEANSTIRRTFLYLTLGVALVVALPTAALILYRLVGVVVGAGLGGNIADLATPLGALVAAAIVLVYHGLALRADQRLAAALPDSSASQVAAPVEPVVEPALSESTMQRRSITLIGPADADLDATVAAIRAALPSGIEISSDDD